MERKPWVAGLLSAICTGLGQFYCGKIKRGIVLFFLFQIVSLLVYRLGVIPLPKVNLILMGLVLSACYLFIIYDAVKIARRMDPSEPTTPYNKWYYYLAYYTIASFLISPLVKTITQQYSVRSYKHPSGSMISSLLPGDYVLADNFNYIFQKPERGDVVVFLYPKNEKRIFVSRVIGLPGEMVEIKDFKVYINDTVLDEPYALVGKEEKHNQKNMASRLVPESYVFLLGDNRQWSKDSRHFGYVHLDSIRGKLKTIYFSRDKNKDGILWNRIGALVD